MRKIIFIAIAVLLVLGGVILIINKKADLASKPPMEEFAINAKIYQPKEKPVKITSQVLAMVKSRNEMQFSSTLPLRVVSILSEGTKFKKGELILELDNSDIQNDIDSASLDIQSARIDLSSKSLQMQTLKENHQRSVKLFNIGGVSTEQLGNEKALIENMYSISKAAEAKIIISEKKKERLQNLLDYTKLIAPFDGIIVSQNTQIGEIATPLKPLVSFANENNKYVEIELPSSINPKGMVYQDKIIDLQKLPVANNSMNKYVSKDLNVNEAIGANINIDLLLYDDIGYFIPNDAFLQIDNKNYLLIYKNQNVIKREIKFIVCGNEGCVTNENITGIKLIQAKPDAMLKALSGVKIAIKE